MRRSLLVLTFISFAGWSQPAQQQAQPPIVVQVQMPPANPWIRLVELIIPGIIGAGLALLGVWFTNKNNAATNAANRLHDAATNAANRQHDLEKLNRAHSFALKRDVLIKFTQSLVRTLAALRTWAGYKEQLGLGWPQY
jgi:hypothetical protein